MTNHHYIAQHIFIRKKIIEFHIKVDENCMIFKVENERMHLVLIIDLYGLVVAGRQDRASNLVNLRSADQFEDLQQRRILKVLMQSHSHN